MKGRHTNAPACGKHVGGPLLSAASVACELHGGPMTEESVLTDPPDDCAGSLIHSEQPEVAEGLFNRRDLVWWTGIRLGCAHWCGNAKLLFAARDPGALGYEAVLPRNPFLDLLARGAWTKRFLLAGLTRAPMSSFLVSITHARFGGNLPYAIPERDWESASP